jgi:molybdopterin/thiamine biosynthesis adenylyltransferase
MSTLGKPKVDVLAAMARDINPSIDLVTFPGGVSSDNVEQFLEGVDLYVDGLDFFAFDARSRTFASCAARAIPACTAAPIGMGAALLNFMPGGMTFEEFFLWGAAPDQEKALRFLLGLAPAGLHRRYLVDPSSVDFAERRGPSTIAACQLCAGMVAAEAVKILLGRGKVLAAPHGMHFDAYRNRFVKTWRPKGNNHPLQRLALRIAARQLSRPQ